MKGKGKRKVSILTVFIWLALVITMSVIVVQGVSKSNALEEGETRKITVKVDFSEYFEKEGITEETEKLGFMGNNYYINGCKTNNITDLDSDFDGTGMFITGEGDIGVYEIEITNEAKYIIYHEIGNTYMNLYKYTIESETNEIEYINFIDDYGEYPAYGEKIKEEQSIYEVKIKERSDLKKITVKVDFREYFEKEGITEETEKLEFMSNYYIDTCKTNNITDLDRDFDGTGMFITGEGDIGVYEIEITNDVKYIRYHYIDDKYMNLYKYTIESEVNEIEYINENENTSYGEKIKEEQDVYEVKLKKILPRNITVKVDFNEFFEKEGIIEEAEKIYFMNRFNICASRTKEITDESDWSTNSSVFISNEGNIGIYELEVPPSYSYIVYQKVKEYRYENYSLENSKNKFEYVKDDRAYYGRGTFYGEKIELDKDIYEVKISSSISLLDVEKIKNTYIYKQAKWINKEKRIANITLGYTMGVTPEAIHTEGPKIYIDKLGDEFELSPEYYNNDEWSILETTSDEKSNLEGIYKFIPKDVQNEFDFGYPKKKYVYVKDVKTIYWLDEEGASFYGAYAITSININVVYNKEVNQSIDAIVETNKEAKLLYGKEYTNKGEEYYNILSPKLKYIHTVEGVIKLSKIVEDEIGENKHYVGIFENNIDSKTDNIYEINTIDGKGDIVIEIPDYNKNKEYYIYEVYENGNKISGKKINNNKLKFESIEDSKISTDKSIISAVRSDHYTEGIWHYDEEKDEAFFEDFWIQDEDGNYYFETDKEETQGTSKIDYTDNILTINDIYQASVTITSEKENDEKYKVEYVAEEGGIIDGEESEVVNFGEYPLNVLTPKAEDGYRFVKWEVEENGERIEVNPSEYVIEKDTVFYAIFEKVEIVNTSDINIFVYILIFFVAIIGVIVGIIFVRKNKVNKK